MDDEARAKAAAFEDARKSHYRMNGVKVISCFHISINYQTKIIL